MRLQSRFTIVLIVAAALADGPTLLGQRGGAGRPDGDAGGRGRAGGPAERRGDEARSPAPLPTGTATIRGQIASAGSGTAIRRATVIATQFEGRGGPRTALSNDNGIYEFLNLPAGRWSVVASKTGFLDYGSLGTQVDIFELTEGQQVVRNLTLSRGGAIAGRVFDEFGEPLASATVIASRMLSSPRGVRISRTGTSVPTDDTGAYRVYGLPPGQYYVSVSDPSATRMGTVSFSFNSAQAESASAARIEAEAVAARLQEAATRLVVAGSEPGVAYAPTYYPGTANIAEAQQISLGLGQEQLSINLSIVPIRAARITGRVLSATGAPVRAQVALSNPLGQGLTPTGGRNGSAADGTFTLMNVPPGNYTLSVLGPNIGAAPPEVASVPLSVFGEDILDLTVTTGVGATVDGTIVSDDGTRLPSARTVVSTVAMSGDNATWTPRAEANANGRFELEGLLGVYALNVSSLPAGWVVKSMTANGVDVSDAPVAFRPGDRVSLRIELTSRVTQVSGTVKLDREARGASVIVFPDDASRWSATSRFIKTTRVGADGRFTVAGLPPNQRYLAIAMDYIESGEAQTPEFLQRARTSARVSFTLSEGEQRVVELPLLTR